MEVVELRDAGERAEIAPDALGVDGGRNGVEGEAQGMPQQVPGSHDDHGDDGEADHGVEPEPVRRQHERAREHHAHGDQRVRGHVEVCTADIEVALPAAHEEQRGDAVDDDADGGHDDHGRALDRSRVEEALHGFEADGAHRDEENDRIEERRQDRRSPVAIGESRVRPLPCERVGSPGNQ
jgi:hypothetical protein